MEARQTKSKTKGVFETMSFPSLNDMSRQKDSLEIFACFGSYRQAWLAVLSEKIAMTALGSTWATARLPRGCIEE